MSTDAYFNQIGDAWAALNQFCVTNFGTGVFTTGDPFISWNQGSPPAIGYFQVASTLAGNPHNFWAQESQGQPSLLVEQILRQTGLQVTGIFNAVDPGSPDSNFLDVASNLEYALRNCLEQVCGFTFSVFGPINILQFLTSGYVQSFFLFAYTDNYRTGVVSHSYRNLYYELGPYPVDSKLTQTFFPFPPQSGGGGSVAVNVGPPLDMDITVNNQGPIFSIISKTTTYP